MNLYPVQIPKPPPTNESSTPRKEKELIPVKDKMLLLKNEPTKNPIQIGERMCL